MNKQKDAAIERMLRASQSRTESAVSPDCVDAEMLAAWMDDKLTGPALARVQAHAAGCIRCQAMLATMARTEEAVEEAAAASEVRQKSGFWRLLPWAAPLTAATTAAVLWLAVGPDVAQSPTEADRNEVSVAAQKEPRAAAPEALASPAQPPKLGAADAAKRERADQSARRAETKEAGVAAAPPRDERDKKDALRAQSKAVAELPQGQLADAVPPATSLPGARSVSSPPPPLAPAAQRSAPLPSAEATAAPVSVGRSAAFATRDSLEEKAEASPPVMIASPDTKIMWRIVAGRIVQQSTDSGGTWVSQATGGDALLTAGAAASSRVCWIVGRTGTVLVTSDGRTWQRRLFPEPVDLVAIHVAGPDAVTITTADGRSFSTKDGGKTWER